VKRVAIWIVLTTIGMVLLFSYHTSTSGPAGAHAAPGVAPAGVVAESPVAAPPAASPAAGQAGTSPAAKAPSAAASPAPLGRASASPRAVVAPSPKPSPAPQPSRTAATTRTINGVAVDTRYGPVQVQIKVSGSRILSSDAIVYPTNERRDREINDRAVPQLNDETVQAQSASIDTVSGATYTSEGYRESLQSALDAAHR
jgi:uncharacterized protein with FMN-binding domain